MRKSITTVLVAFGFFLSVLITTSAMAGGWGIGIIGAAAEFRTKGSETEGGLGAGPDNKEKTVAEKKKNLMYGSVFAEYTWGELYGVTLGASWTPGKQMLGAQSRTDTEPGPTSLDSNASQDAGTYNAEAKVSNHATIYIEPTFSPSDNWGMYLKGGLARVKVDSLEVIALGDDSSAYGEEVINGIMYGVGMKGGFESGMFYKLEVIRIIYDEVKMTSTTGNKNIIAAEPEQLAGRLAIGFRF